MLALLRGSAGLCLTGALAVLVLMVAGVTVGQAGEQGPEPSRGGMRSEAAGATPTCPTEACMALTVKGGTCVDAACTVSNGQKFTLAVEVEVAPAGDSPSGTRRNSVLLGPEEQVNDSSTVFPV